MLQIILTACLLFNFDQNIVSGLSQTPLLKIPEPLFSQTSSNKLLELLKIFKT